VNARVFAALAAAAALGAAGCASTSDHALNQSLGALATPVAQAPVSAPSSASTVRCADPTASLRPTGALPAPGAMPAGSFMAAIRKRGRLIAGVDQNTLLFAYLKPSTGRIEGFEIDLLREVARALFGNPNAIEFKALTTAQRLPFVQRGAVDIVADAVTMTCDRRRQVDFSTTYYDAAQRLLVPANAPPLGVTDVAGERVCATRGSTSLQTLEQKAAAAHPYPVDQRTDCLVALQQGRVDAITSDDAILLGFRAQDPNTKIVGAPLADEPYGMAISRAHPDFVRFVNGVLARMRADGRWAAIYRRWLGGVTSRTPQPPRPHYAG
jgi:polar amino acid transport system substrate-binding protein